MPEDVKRKLEDEAAKDQSEKKTRTDEEQEGVKRSTDERGGSRRS